MIVLALYFLSLCQGKLSEVPHTIGILHIQSLAFWKRCFFRDNRNLILLQKMFIQKFLRIAVRFNLCFAVICALLEQLLLPWSLKCRIPGWKELCHGCCALQGPENVRESLFSKMKCCLFEHMHNWLRPVLCQL